MQLVYIFSLYFNGGLHYQMVLGSLPYTFSNGDIMRLAIADVFAFVPNVVRAS